MAVLEAADPVAAFFAVERDAGRLALRTSGTSGPARVVVRTARSWTDSFPAVAELTGLSPDSRVWIPGPLSATMNLFAAVHAAAVGATIVDSPAAATHLQLTPSRLAELLDAGGRLPGRTAVVAGDGLDPGLRMRAEDAGARVAHYYGAAELSFVAWGADRDELRAFPGVELAVRDGEIWARSPYLAAGYLPTGPDGGAGDGPLRFAPDGYATVGDRGRLAGDRLVVEGRPGAILTGGATVLVADVEAAIRPVVRDQLAVVGLPHPRLGQVVVGVLTDEADLPAARRASSELGAGRPRRWYVLGRLPLTGAGKLDRTQLARELAEPAGPAEVEP